MFFGFRVIVVEDAGTFQIVEQVDHVPSVVGPLVLLPLGDLVELSQGLHLLQVTPSVARNVPYLRVLLSKDIT